MLPGSLFSKFWLVANLIGWCGLILVLILLSREFLGFPTTVVIDVKSSTYQRFPAVSVCNMNRMNGQVTRQEKYFEVRNDITSGDYTQLVEISSTWNIRLSVSESLFSRSTKIHQKFVFFSTPVNVNT